VPQVIDAHAHVIVPEIVRSRGSGDRWRPSVSWRDGVQVVERAGREIRSATREFVYVDAILDAQAAAGIDRTVLSPWVALLGDDAPLDDAVRSCRIQNEALHALVEAHPERLSAVGTVPLQDPHLAATEVEAVMTGSRLSGVEVPTSVAGLYLGDPRFEPFWEAAEATAALVFVHPTARGSDLAAMQDHYLWNSVGNPLELAVAGAHLVMSGVVERHPDLRVLLAHGGGALLAVRGRLRHAHTFQPDARSRLRASPDVSIRRLFFDTITHDDDLLRALVGYVTPEHVLLGSDYPFDMGEASPAERVRGLGLTPSEERKILGGNAERLLGLVA